MSEGGYDYQFVAPGPTDNLKCPICHLVVRDAHQVTCCGKLFCNGCLQKSQLLGNGLCPHCRQNFTEVKNAQSDCDVNGLKVLCSYKGVGCEWTGTVKDIEAHMRDCSHKEIECPQCGEKKAKLLIDRHLEHDCPSREHTCPLCEETGTYCFITGDHQNQCPLVEVACPNQGCTVRVKQQDSAQHASVCLKEKVECPFASFGCGFQGRRENLTQHIEADYQPHMESIARYMNKLSIEFENASSRNRTAPITIKLTELKDFKQTSMDWYSNGFYTGPGGYKVRLNVYNSGYDDGQSSYVSVFINLMPGIHDDSLEFPMRGEIKITLLNQLNDANHYCEVVRFHGHRAADRRKYEVDDCNNGVQKFIEHDHLLQRGRGICYLMNDTLYFRVEANIVSQTKPWLNVV